MAREIVDMANDLMDRLLADVDTRLAIAKTDSNPHGAFYITKVPQGCQVSVVIQTVPAGRAGLLPRDIITGINGVDARTPSLDQMTDASHAASIELSVRRPGGPTEIDVRAAKSSEPAG